MKSFKFLVVLVSILMIIAAPSAFAFDYGFTVKNSGDPCQNPNVEKTSVPISLITAQTATIVQHTTGKVMYICDFAVTASGASSLQLKSGTTTTTGCDGSTTNLTGAMNLATGAVLNVGPGSTIAKTGTSHDLCTTSTGSVYGVMTYVTQ